MPIGDMFAGLSSVLDGAYLDIQPAANHEAVIHNIHYAGAVEIYWYDGANEILIDSAAAAGSHSFYAFHVNNTHRVRVKNVSGGDALIGYDGIYTVDP